MIYGAIVRLLVVWIFVLCALAALDYSQIGSEHASVFVIIGVVFTMIAYKFTVISISRLIVGIFGLSALREVVKRWTA